MLCLRPSLGFRPTAECVEMYDSEDARTPVFHLHPITATALALCDGRRTVSEVVTELVQIFGLDERDAQFALAGAKARFGIFLRQGGTRNPVDIELLIFTSSYEVRRYEAPVSLIWVVTGYCDKGCIYCYQAAKRSFSAPDATLSTDRVKQLVDEAVAIGVSTMKLSGGEPFLRPDLYELITYMIDKGIDVRILTKWAFSREDAERLAATGLKQIVVSVDSIDEAASDSLVMVKGYTRQAHESIRNLMAVGISVEVNSVVCATNLGQMESSIAAWREMGVDRITVSEFWASAGRTPSHLKLSPEQLQQLVAMVDAHKDDPVCPVEYATECDSLVDMHSCSHGLNTMALLPDGSVSRCEHIPVSIPEIIVGNLATQSILEVWNAQRYVDLIFPEEELYAGTACHGCGEFTTCNTNGRCLMVPLVQQQRLFGPSCSQVFVQLDEEVL